MRLTEPVSGHGKTWAATAALPTQTGRQDLALATPPAFLVEFQGTSATRPLTAPLGTILAGGEHHAVATPPAFLISYYGQDQGHALTAPLGTIPTRDKHALVTLAPAPADLEALLAQTGFRMLTVPELAAGQGFAPSYVFTGPRRDQVRQIGNAVSTTAARDLADRAMTVFD